MASTEGDSKGTSDINNSHADTAAVPDTVANNGQVSASITPSNFAADTTTPGSKMNPLAIAFNPPQNQFPLVPALPPDPAASHLYELRTTDNRGLGLFATRSIPLGTLIICEEPLVRTATNNWAQVWAPYNELGDELKAIFDRLHLRDCHSLDYEQMSRAYLANNVDTLLPNGDLTSEIADHVRIMKIFAANSFQLPGDGLAVFATAARLNHACVPNVQHSFNPTLNSMTVHAVRDIPLHEELVISYLSEATYQTSAERMVRLHSAYGFECQCFACSDATGLSDGRRVFMRNLAMGLSHYNQDLFVPHPYIPADPVSALKQAEDHISCMMEEGILTSELAGAFRMASSMAFNLGDLDRALEYARDEQVVQRNCLGSQIQDLRKTGAATESWLDVIYNAIRARRGDEAAMMYRGVVRGEKKNKHRNKNAHVRAKKVTAKEKERLDGHQDTTGAAQEDTNVDATKDTNAPEEEDAKCDTKEDPNANAAEDMDGKVTRDTNGSATENTNTDANE